VGGARSTRAGAPPAGETRDRLPVVVTGGGTGGHLYPGLAIARALVRLDPRVAPIFVGAQRGIEREVLPTTEFPHLLLDLHPLYRQRPWENWRTIVGAARSLGALGRLFAAERPHAVLGTGGYAAGLALAYGSARGVPILLQEADSHPGQTTRAFAPRAHDVFLGFPEGARLLRPGPRTQIHTFGNPIEPPPTVRPSREEARRAWELPEDVQVVLLVFGGSQGARAINEAVGAWVRGGLPDALGIIWATGKGQFDASAALDRAAGGRVRVVPYLAPIAGAYAATDLALTRAGAMSIAELCAWGLPSILVPLPTAAADHQTRNARALADAGAAIALPQAELSAARLDAAVRELLAGPERLATFAAAALERGRPDAAVRIARRSSRERRRGAPPAERSDVAACPATEVAVVERVGRARASRFMRARAHSLSASRAAPYIARPPMALLLAPDPRPVHFVGIAGAGMSALAELFVRRGATVTGCDASPGGADLARLGVAVEAGHDAQHVAGARALVVTSAMAKDHPELVAARSAGLPVIRRAEALAEACAGGVLVGVAGTHGKTTTTVLTTEALAAAGLAVTGVVGGRVGAWGGNLRYDGAERFVVEADEYDRSFLALTPTVAVVTNVEADHLDIYADLADIRGAFTEYAGAPASSSRARTIRAPTRWRIRRRPKSYATVSPRPTRTATPVSWRATCASKRPRTARGRASRSISTARRWARSHCACPARTTCATRSPPSGWGSCSA
jgi:UDP-N-acetylglucosamine--N-acetylmuramyl-(pentapeptide) pyrophosphoryl-undecaprenol N-acetylglucosamine transferase